MKVLALIVASVFCATIAYEALYMYVLVPQMNHWLKVPTVYWLMAFAPFIFVALTTGYFTHTGERIVPYTFLCAAATLLTRMLILYLTGQQPGHDIAWKDLSSPPNVFIAAFAFGMVALSFAAFIVIGFLVRKWRTNIAV